MTCEVTDIGSMLLTVIMQKYFLQAWRLGVLSALVSTGNYGPIYKNTISPTPLALKQPHISHSYLQDYAFSVVVLARFTANMLDSIWGKQIYLCLIWLEMC